MPGLRHAHTLQQLRVLLSTHPRESIKTRENDEGSDEERT